MNELLNLTKIKTYLSSDCRHYLENAIIFDEIASTNLFLTEGGVHQGKQYSICLAESQTQGRGRLNKSWVSPFGCNLYLSVLQHFPGTPAQLSGLSLAIATVLAEVLTQYGAQGIQLKWPNDVLWQNRKLAGILIELGRHQNAVIGIGLNLAMPDELKQDSIVDLAEIMKKTPERNKLAAQLIENLLKALEQFKQKGLQPFLSLWKHYDKWVDQPVQVLMGAETVEGQYLGVDEKGCMILQTHDGVKRQFFSGEVSLRLRVISPIVKNTREYF